MIRYIIAVCVVLLMGACSSVDVQMPDYGTTVEGYTVSAQRRKGRVALSKARVVRYQNGVLGIRADVEAQMRVSRGMGIASETVTEFQKDVLFRIAISDKEGKILEEAKIPVQRARRTTRTKLEGEIAYTPTIKLDKSYKISIRILLLR